MHTYFKIAMHNSLAVKELDGEDYFCAIETSVVLLPKVGMPALSNRNCTHLQNQALLKKVEEQLSSFEIKPQMNVYSYGEASFLTREEVHHQKELRRGLESALEAHYERMIDLQPVA
jgi:hypothetical protein